MGAAFVKEHGEGNEQYNFDPVISEDGQCILFRVRRNKIIQLKGNTMNYISKNISRL